MLSLQRIPSWSSPGLRRRAARPPISVGQRSLDDRVAELMTRVHCISRELANYHVATMDLDELVRRFRQYTGMELSASGATNKSESDLYPVFGFATATARIAALNPVPELEIEPESSQSPARAGNRRPGPMVVRAVSANH